VITVLVQLCHLTRLVLFSPVSSFSNHFYEPGCFGRMLAVFDGYAEQRVQGMYIVFILNSVNVIYLCK